MGVAATTPVDHKCNSKYLKCACEILFMGELRIGALVTPPNPQSRCWFSNMRYVLEISWRLEATSLTIRNICIFCAFIMCGVATVTKPTPAIRCEENTQKRISEVSRNLLKRHSRLLVVPFCLEQLQQTSNIRNGEMECLIKVLLILSFVALHSVGLYWVRGRTSYGKIPWSLEALKLDVIMFVSLWNLTSGAAEIPVKFKSDWKSPTRIIRLRDFTRSCGKTSVCIVNRGPILIRLYHDMLGVDY